MSIQNLKAVGIHILVKRHDAEEKIGGLVIPDNAKKKAHKGDILSIGRGVTDLDIKKGKTAVFNQHVGQDITVDGETITVLKESEIIGVL